MKPFKKDDYVQVLLFKQWEDQKQIAGKVGQIIRENGVFHEMWDVHLLDEDPKSFRCLRTHSLRLLALNEEADRAILAAAILTS